MKYALFIRKTGKKELILDSLKNENDKSSLLTDSKLEFLGYMVGNNLNYIKDRSPFNVQTGESYRLNGSK